MILLIKNCIYCVAILISLFSIVTMIWSIKNKNQYICKNVILFSIIYIIYLIVDLSMIYILYIPIGLEALFIFLVMFIAGILYVISVILNLIKRKKLERYAKKKKVLITTIILIILPIIFFSVCVLRQKYLINNSDLVLVYSSSGNGGFGDEDTFAYAIGEDYCKQFDLGIDINGYRLKEFLPKNAVKITNIDDIAYMTDYKMIPNEEDFDAVSVYKDNKQICKINYQSRYFNIDFEKGFYIKH